MLFQDIEPRMKIIILVTNGSDMQAKFMSKVMKNDGESILVIPFRHKGVRINFSGKNVKVHMEARDNNGLLWTFMNCHISTIRKNGLMFHKITSGFMKGIENRREGRRFYYWEKAIFTIEGFTNQIFTHIKDIGEEGFSFVIEHKKKMDVREGKRVNCTFKNSEGEEISLDGMVVRREEIEKYMVYGCKIDNPPQNHIDFVKWLERKNTVVDVDF